MKSWKGFLALLKVVKSNWFSKLSEENIKALLYKKVEGPKKE